MALAPEKQDANLVGLFKIREATFKTVPATGDWSEREPNSFDDMGTEYTSTARTPFNQSRQRRRGRQTDSDTDGGYNEDLTQNNMQGEFEEFFFAALRKTPEVDPSAVTSTVYTVAASTGFHAGDLVLARGYANAGNNGVKELTAVGATSLTAAGLTAEASPPAAAGVKLIGHKFAASDIVVTLDANGFPIVTATAASFTDYPLIPGQMIFFMLDDSIGYARIAANGVAAKTLRFDKTTFPAAAEAGTGLQATIYFSDVIKNEDDPDLIVRYSSTMERTLGRDADGRQSQYLVGMLANEMTWNSPLSALVNIDMSYIGMRSGRRTGAEGPLTRRASNTIVKALKEAAFSTSSDVYRLRLAMIDPTTLNPSPLFARVTEWNAAIANGITATKGQGEKGAFDATTGDFTVTGEWTAFFTTMEAIHAVDCDWDMTFDAIYAKQNAGIYMDMPLLGLGGGRLDIEKDAAIMLPLTGDAAESAFGHTLLIGWFPYLPSEAMPDSDC